MEKNLRSCFSGSFIILSLGFLALAALVMVGFVFYRTQQVKSAQYIPPVVTINYPLPEAELPMGNYSPVSVVAMGSTPIQRLELWVDGVLVAKQESKDPQGVSPFFGNFTLMVQEGYQFLFVRAVNTLGIIGQSQPVRVNGGKKPDLNAANYIVPVGEGEALADIANAYEVPLDAVQAANPGLGDQPPVPGANINVPVAPQNEPLPTAPAQPPAQPQGQITTGPQVQPLAPGGQNLAASPNNLIFNLVNNVVLFAGTDKNPPAAPTDLQANIDDCALNLNWKDNAVNEESYEIWIATPYMTKIATLKAAPGTGTVWYKVNIPSDEKMVFWVKAVNFYGSQSSDMVVVKNIQGCMGKIATNLRLTIFTIFVKDNSDRFYCYISFNDTPQVRIPVKDNTFVEIKGGVSTNWSSVNGTYIVPVPENEAISLKGECWGWSGNVLSNLGSFNNQFPKTSWNGTTQKITTPTYEIRFTISPEGHMFAYGFDDPTLSKPFDLSISSPKGNFFPTGDISWKWERYLTWKWSGDEKAITGFTIYRNGVPILSETIPPNGRQATVHVQKLCDDNVRWEVAANSSAGRALSVPLIYNQPKCELNLVIVFKDIHFLTVYDYSPGFYKANGCNEASEGYFFFIVNGEKRDFFGNGFYQPFKGCKWYNIADLTEVYQGKYPQPGVFKVPFADRNQVLNVDILAEFWDDDDGPNDRLSSFSISLGGLDYAGYESQINDFGNCSTRVSKNSDDDGSGELIYCISLEEIAPGY